MKSLAAGRRFLVWVIAAFGTFEAVLQVIVTGLDRDATESIVWFFGSAMIFATALFVEKIKAFEGA